MFQLVDRRCSPKAAVGGSNPLWNTNGPTVKGYRLSRRLQEFDSPTPLQPMRGSSNGRTPKNILFATCPLNS